MKRVFLLVVLLLGTAGAQAQNRITSNQSVTVNIIGVDYAYEQALGGKFTIIGRAGIESAMGWTSWDGFVYSINPTIGVESRYYYNVNRRLALDKRVDGNSANFLALEYRYFFNPIASHGTETAYPIVLSPTWGLRRVWNDRWLFELNTGINMLWDRDYDMAWGPRLNLKFGVLF